MLEGKVGDFSLPEIFQLIALTKKNGTLTISAPAQEGRVRFRDGEVVEAASDVRRLALGARLVAAGLVDESQLAAALEAKRDGGGEVLGVLLDHAAIEEGSLHAFVREQIADAVADMLRLADATFRFDAEEAPAEPLIDVQVATDQLVAEGNQRLAEWDAIRQHVPASDTVFAVAPAPLVEGTQVVVDAEDWQVLALVDGRRPVREIVELSGRSEFGTSKALAGLAARKLVEPCGDDEDGHPLSSLLARREVLRRLEELELSEIRPGPPQPAPATEDAEPGPASEEPSGDRPEADDRVPAPEDPAPAQEDPVPAGEDPAPAGEDPAPAGEDPAPAGEDPAPAGEEDRPIDEPGGDTVPPAPAFDDGAAQVPNGDAPATASEGAGTIDRAQVARELAALGLDDFGSAQPAPGSPAEPPGGESRESESRSAPGEQGPGERRLVRDDDLNRGLLLRLIDGVKGA